LLDSGSNNTNNSKRYALDTEAQRNHSLTIPIIGYLNSCYTERNGTPRQGLLAPSSRATLQVLLPSPNAHQALEGLALFSHVWLLFEFHLNTNSVVRPKIHPPRLHGSAQGLYATRTPHRPAPIGLSCAKIESIHHDTITLSCIDLVHGTPIIDIKPYIPYDCIAEAVVPSWVGRRLEHAHDDPLVLDVSFVAEFDLQLQPLLPHLRFYQSIDLLKSAIQEILCQDIRSPAMRKQSSSTTAEFGFCIDCLNVKFTVPSSTVCIVTGVELWQNYAPPPSSRSNSTRDRSVHNNCDASASTHQ
jgi:tRNA (adenine37-N6)-methyltransferase